MVVYSPMQDTSAPPQINSWLEDELLSQYRHDKSAVDSDWFAIFGQKNGAPAQIGAPGAAPGAPERAYAPALEPAPVTARLSQRPPAPEPPPVAILEHDQVTPLRGPALRIAENMSASLSIPVATSQRVIPVKVIDENRRLINQHRSLTGASKVSYTHLIAWAIVRAIEKVPAVNQAYAERGGESLRIVRGEVNLGLAVDVEGKDGARSLKVPALKNAQAMNFAEFLAAYDDIVQRARKNKLTVADFEGVTISLTNPGTVGTTGSNPRLMPGQGAIIATGAIDYPPEYRGVPEDIRASLGLSKVMTVTCTYDHRVIQGAESGLFLARLQELLEGEDDFYTKIFADLNIPLQPLKWQADQSAAPVVNSDPMKQAGVAKLIQAWRQRGHLVADIDPLGTQRPPHPDLDPASHGLTIWDLDRTFHAAEFGVATLRSLLDRLRLTYAGKMGVQYEHIDNADERRWLQQRMEPTANQWPIEAECRKRALKDIVLAEGFEQFLDNRFKGHKRFSLEGGETMIAMIEELLERAAAHHAVDEVVIGMAHRGRLTLLANVIGKGIAQMFSEFEGDIHPEAEGGSGDVKYHLGESSRRKLPNGGEITVSVAPNPSHLEAVNPVVEGIVRPKQDFLKDSRRELVIPVLIHGDAAMAGQGIVAETLNLSQIEGYNTGGTIHLVINNQIGFTTTPEASRSSEYATDVALMVAAPIFHVNGNDPDACLRATQLAYDYRQRFHRDVVIDLVCYRKHGHNEGDDASYTQPIMARRIAAITPPAAAYASRLIAQGIVTREEIEAWQEEQKKKLYEIYDHTQKVKEEYELHELNPVPDSAQMPELPPTGVEPAVIHQILNSITSFPPDFHLHPKLLRAVEKRREAHHGPSIDWALAETLAFGSLLLEGTKVRLSGQDSGRGTFSQRHAQYHDYETDRVYTPLQHLSPSQAPFEVYNSPLSEFAIVGFEFGYSVSDPFALVLWEAQYGDFSNGAQIIIDQFISSAESKWGQPSGMVMLLPHGQEGGGPEHSSARLERYLQLCAEGNMQVVNCTTPAQYFHLLRRQMRGGADRRGLRKPLIVMTPKSLLRHPKVVSSVDELTTGVFLPVLSDPTIADPAAVRRVLICTGKIYYELLPAREARGAVDTAIIRMEQLYPFPEAELRDVLGMYRGAETVIWVQEEPRNMGAWSFVRWQLQHLLAPQQAFGFAGRPRSASTAPGSPKQHAREQAQLIDDAFAPPTVMRKARRRLVRRRKS
jgi:2-oxoglutarate decarboxylase